ncbi:flagellar basal-body rod protein FlgG [Bdellovibrio sp. HCB2-146]|uniref:flagellar basal-body rod protein FlgG n=1 Tax=Bdellovibrio sp. HCB2-146 TaxID=3394362 RepID=UPI0039BCEB7F
MIKSLNTAATGMAAQQTNMDVIANNIANSSTNGFKKSRAEFEDLMYQTQKEPGAVTGMNAVSPNGVQTGLGVKTAAIQKDFDNGSSVVTKNPLDLQVEGAGFFQVLTPDGDVAYTRDGSFKKDPNGRIVDKNGNALQPEITVPPNVSGLEVAPNGEVRVIVGMNDAPQTIGQIDLTNFVNPAGLKAVGKNLFMQTPASGQPLQSRPGLNGTGYLAQGQLESSNVNIVDEMVNMITAQRAYETNSKVIQASDQMLQSVNNLR